MLVEQAKRFMDRKVVAEILTNKTITMFHISRLNCLFMKYTSKELENMHATIAKFVLYDLNNYEGRLRRLKGIPGTNKYTQLLRYGKKEVQKIYETQNKRKTSHFKNKIDYWLGLGYTSEEAAQQVSKCQKSRSDRSPVTQTGVREYSGRCIAYWLKKGLSEKEAKDQVANVQRRNHTPERNIKWQSTLNSKTEEEKKRINIKKGHSVNAFVKRGFTKEDALLASNAYYAKRKNYSKSSQAFFSLLDSLMGFSHKTYYKAKNYEKQFNGKCVDFFDDVTGTVVEYYGDFWHRNPKKYDALYEVYGKTSQVIWSEDAGRIASIESDKRVNQVIIVWESEVNTNPHKVAAKIIKDIEKCTQKHTR